MGASKYDLIVDGTSARVFRGKDTYKERFVRAEVTQNLLTQAEGASQASRPDQARLYQTSWSGGAQWWAPIISAENASSYFKATNLDTWTEPGSVLPMNTVALVNIENVVNGEARVIAQGGGNLYAIAGTNVDEAANFDVSIWTPASNNFVRDPNYNSGMNAAAKPVAMSYDPSDGYFYLMSDDDEINRFNPATEAENDGWITTGFTAHYGANVFLHNGAVMFYSGDQIYTINKVAPSVTSVFNDGLGPEYLNGTIFAPINTESQLRLAIASPEGIYYVKNAQMGEAIVPWIFRVDRDEAGNWIGNPLGTLPPGSAAVSIAYHLGSLIILAAEDVGTLSTGDAEMMVLYHVTQGSMGAIGTLPQGKADMSRATWLLGSVGPYLYIGGSGAKLLVYDAVGGGIHHCLNVSSFDFHRMASVVDSTGDSCLLFLSDIDTDTARLLKTKLQINPDTVSAFGDDETHYTLESNYFDMNLPMETKEITRVAMIADTAATASAQEWTLQISTDDAAFADVLTHSGTSQYAEATISAGTHRGRLFRYKLIYQTKVAIKRALRAILVTANAGEMIREWEVVLDGTSLENVGNVPVRPAVFAEALRATAVKEQAVTIVLNYQDPTGDATADTGETVTAKIQFCELIKDSPSEARIHLIFREA